MVPEELVWFPSQEVQVVCASMVPPLRAAFFHRPYQTSEGLFQDTMKDFSIRRGFIMFHLTFSILFHTRSSLPWNSEGH